MTGVKDEANSLSSQDGSPAALSSRALCRESIRKDQGPLKGRWFPFSKMTENEYPEMELKGRVDELHNLAARSRIGKICPNRNEVDVDTRLMRKCWPP